MSVSQAARDDGAQAHGALMNRVYRHQRHIYDVTRRFYLLGRDRLIARLAVPANGTVLEIGCGTGRNLTTIARRYPSSRLFGIDVSSNMLCSASRKVARAGLGRRVNLAVADATQLDLQLLFGQAQFDRVVFSYTLSMIPDWRNALAQAAQCVAPGGSLHIVDFGGQDYLPRWFKALLYAWLRRFHVTPRLDLEEELAMIAARYGAEVGFDRPFRGYAQYAVLRR